MTGLALLTVTGAAIGLGGLLSWPGGATWRALVGYLAAAVAATFLTPTEGATPWRFTLVELVFVALRLWIALDLARRAWPGIPGARAAALRVVLLGMVAIATAQVIGASVPSSPRATFRALALAAGCTGALLLGLRAVAARYEAQLHPVDVLASEYLGVYLMLHGMLLGAATEGAAWARAFGSDASSMVWALWAAALAPAAWKGRTA